MYRLSSFRDGTNICLEIQSPYETKPQFHVFPTYAGYSEYIDNLLWHFKMSNKEYEWGDRV